MQGGTEGHLYRLQIQVARLLALGEDAAQRLVTSRATSAWIASAFFSSGVRVSSTGRNAQIFSLTSTTSPLSF
jgi:hypothetical protein